MCSTSWLIVVFDNICLKANGKIRFLGVKKGSAPPVEIEGGRVILAVFPIGEHMGGKVKFGGKMTVFTDKFTQFILF